MTSSASAEKKIKLSVLCSDKAKGELDAEHGLAIWLEATDHTILFDTGGGESLDYNSELMGIDPTSVDTLVLSHGHYDHTGGIVEVLKGSTHCHLWASPSIAAERYKLDPDKKLPRSIGMPPAALERLNSLPSSRLIYADHPQYIANWLGISGFIPREHPLEEVSDNFFFDIQGEKPDNIADENTLWIESQDGIIILAGCCHAGLINTINHIRKHSKTDKVVGIIGGLHLMKASEERLKATTDFLKELDLEFILAGHCTGDKSLEYFKKELPDLDIREMKAGDVREFLLLGK